MQILHAMSPPQKPPLRVHIRAAGPGAANNLPGISHSTQPSLQAHSKQRQTLLLKAWGQFCPQPDVC